MCGGSGGSKGGGGGGGSENNAPFTSWKKTKVSVLKKGDVIEHFGASVKITSIKERANSPFREVNMARTDTGAKSHMLMDNRLNVLRGER